MRKGKQTSKKRGNWSKLSQAERRREKFLIRRECYLGRTEQQMVENYEPGSKGLSVAEGVKRSLRIEHPGVNMFYYVGMFLGDMGCNAKNFDKMYQDAIKFALSKYISGHVHYTEKKRKVVTSEKDTEQLMLECLRASGRKGEVEAFFREIILN